MSKRFSKFKVGLALGGGAARGVVHLGVLEELERAGIEVDMIAGTSIGSAIGGLYALEPDARLVSQKFIKFLRSEDFRGAKMDFLHTARGAGKGVEGIMDRVSKRFRKSVFYGISLANVSFLPEDILQKNLGYLIPDVDFTACKIPFSCGATDLIAKDIVYFSEGSMRDAILASCSIPGIFPPVKMGKQVLIDGSWAVQNPVRRVRQMGADFVIAVDIILDERRQPDLKNSFDVLISGGVVTRKMLAQVQLEEADVVIRPNTCDIHWADFAKAPGCVKRGSQETEKHIAEIKRKLKGSKLKRFVTGKSRWDISDF